MFSVLLPFFARFKVCAGAMMAAPKKVSGCHVRWVHGSGHPEMEHSSSVAGVVLVFGLIRVLRLKTG